MNTRRTLRSNPGKLIDKSEEQTDATKQKNDNEGKSKYKEEDSSSDSGTEEEIDNDSTKHKEIEENISSAKSRKRVKSKFDSDSDDGSSSDSSVGDYLQNADEIDLNSTFFKLDKSRKTPDFDSIEKKIFTGIKTLSDSDISDVEKEPTNVSDIKPTSSVQDLNNEEKKSNFSQLHEYNKKLAEAKACVQKYEKKRFETENVDVSDLLAICEPKNNESQESMESANSGADSEDEMDWEEIEEGDDKPPDGVNIPKEGVQITLEMPKVVRKKKGVDFIAAIKRRINRVKKENQVYIHKVHLLCWIAHGNFLNSVINNEHLLGLALSLIPSENCYPKKHADLRYLEQIVRWYGKMMKIQENTSDENKPLLESLQMQITKKQALSKRDLVLIFVIILRSLGLQCRLVMSLQCLPLRPPNSELCSLSTKEKTATSSKESNKNDKSKNTVKSVKDSSSQKLDQSTKNANKNKTIGKTNNNAKGKLKANDKENEVKKPNLSKLKAQSPIAVNSKAIPKKEMPVNKLDTKIPTDRKTIRSRNAAERNTKKENISDKINKSSSSISTKSKKKPTQISQLDGADDSPSTSKSNQKNKPNLNKLKTSEKDNSRTDTCISKRHPRRVKSQERKYNDTTGNSEDDFKPSPRKSSTERSSGKEKDLNGNKKKVLKKMAASTSQKAKLDVRNDIINLIKGQMTEQRHSKKHKIVGTKTSHDESDYDSDYAPEPEKKSRSSKKSSSDDDFKIKVNTNVKRRVKPRSQLDTRVLSTDDEESGSGGKKKKVGTDFWVEVFLEAEEKWISADIIKGQVHCVSELHSRASQPVSYILAWNNNFSLKDVTARYSPNWNTVTRKLRVDSAWWNQTLKPFRGVKTSRDKQEDEDLARQQLDKPLPTTISEYKNHPLYALERHLLKFEAIYPPDSVTLGFVRKEPVYARECVHTLHSREIWVKHAKVVKPGEQPYKIVKARPKYDKLSGNMITDLPLELFGNWQIQDYVPPTAENGVVPRNAFGNVELFKSCMLPKKTVHLQLPGLNKIARKLQIDCAPAVVGFDFHCGGSHPTFDGYVVCEEFKDTLIAAWEEDQEETARREQEKCEKRVYGNWRKLIKGLLIRERLKARYDFGNTSNSSSGKGKSKAPKVVTKKRRICSDKESDSD